MPNYHRKRAGKRVGEKGREERGDGEYRGEKTERWRMRGERERER